MPTSLPRSNVTVKAQPSGMGSGSDLIAVIAPVAKNNDLGPILYQSAQGIVDQYGYCEGASYAAMHIAQTKRSVVFVGVPIAVPATVSNLEKNGHAWIDDVLGSITTETQGILKCTVGGETGTTGIEFSMSLDNGQSWKTIRLGTATTYTDLDTGTKIDFVGSKTVEKGDTITWESSGPKMDATALGNAFKALAASQHIVRTVLVVGVADDTFATAILTNANAYASSHERFVSARATIADKDDGTAWPVFASAAAGTYGGVNGMRLSLSLGHRRTFCPITHWAFRRPACWAASLLEYDRGADIHTTTWRRDRGPLQGWFTGKGDDEYDERVHGGALAGRFSCFTSQANETGIVIAKDLTRDNVESPMLLPSNVAVANEACTIVQRVTDRWLGRDLVLNPDGTAAADEIVTLETEANSALARGVLSEHVPGRGMRANNCVFIADPTSVLRGAAGAMNGIVELDFKGVISQVNVTVMAR